MGNLTKYNAANINQLLDRINRNSIGMDEYFDRLFNLQESASNYPPYNLVQVSNTESRLELALAGFKEKEVNVYTQDGKLFVEGQREDGETGTNMSTEEWIRDLSPELGHFQMKRKLDQLLLRMGY